MTLDPNLTQSPFPNMEQQMAIVGEPYRLPGDGSVSLVTVALSVQKWARGEFFHGHPLPTYVVTGFIPAVKVFTDSEAQSPRYTDLQGREFDIAAAAIACAMLTGLTNCRPLLFSVTNDPRAILRALEANQLIPTPSFVQPEIAGMEPQKVTLGIFRALAYSDLMKRRRGDEEHPPTQLDEDDLRGVVLVGGSDDGPEADH